MPIFQRTIKLILATVLATYLADWLGLAYATSAGIIAILSVLDTRKSSFKMAGNRLFSTLLALTIASLTFVLFGFDIWTLTIYLAFYVPIAYHFGWEAGIAPSTVLAVHLLLEQNISFSFLGNELALFLLGTGLALLFNNLYMPSQEQNIEAYHAQVEDLLKQILLRFESFLLNGDGRNEAQLINQLDLTLEKALKVVYLDRHNQLFQQTNYQVHYFEMRAAQNKILRTMAGNINKCLLEGRENIILASLFERVAQQLSRENSAKELLLDIELFHTTFRERPLPQTREEFETRATLFQLLHDMEAFIRLKVEFYQTYSKEDEKDPSV
ncbi:aromatic acid exporter family protein [Streptococcus ruminantium]|uniref:Aromatic acid exporter family protein n=1 Tax=Streptococcus ruminantium TaxID=1917441 RepID=A0ABU1B2W0_9STRE|nr:aromatic acid exporter family protein [Streptococcus ruminantium]MDQ8758652.1 aromatic acid exporter family protein [Streptococcus ruminantium]MDQ8769071.1 aromatic acid exporter family protein [Streptococcus ruminantium]MDQ8774070.1 aromatic acid exporter family protein [Streptococcus ruminantium]MDQ8793099.1 aromatic acid exporter family protein [Streptococcus ruminantium]MDQ8795295.1 aromatic acid exporter family protein [Streptococcus ruminantium]